MGSDMSKRGRPEDPVLQEERKSALLDAAFELLQQKGYRSITIREIADKAEMKSAMISYYFGGKEGLFLGILERFAQLEVGRFKTLRNDPEPLRGFIRTAISNFSRNPAITRLLVDEVMSSDSHLRDRFIELMPKQIATLLPVLVKIEQAKGRIRQDADPKWLAFSLVTMVISPFIGAVVRDQAWNISHDEVSSDVWAEHIYRLFMEGAGQ